MLSKWQKILQCVLILWALFSGRQVFFIPCCSRSSGLMFYPLGTRSPKVSNLLIVHFKQSLETVFFFSLRPPYNALKVDVWSLGATVWEMAQTEPPFSDTQQFGDRWPPLRQPKLYSPAFHDFLRKCSDPPSSRPNPSDLLKVRSSFPTAILHLVELCPFTASFHP